MTGPIPNYPIANWNSTAGWNFNAILSEFRSICGIPDASMYSDAQCATLINYYYQYVLPKELKIFWGYTFYEFFTQAGVDQYLAPTGFQTVNPSVWADGFPIEWYLSPDTFYQDYPQNENKLVVGNGNPPLNSFPFNTSAYPIIQRSLYVTDGTQVMQDIPINATTGNLVNAIAPFTGGSGTVTYATGVVSSLAFPAPPAANTTITATSQTYFSNRPQGILFFPQQAINDSTQDTLNAVNMFVLRPIPDQVYVIKMQGIKIPPALINYTDVPFRPDLGPLIALGAALHRFKLFNQMDQYDQYMPEFLRFKDVCMQDTYEELIYTRSVPTF